MNIINKLTLQHLKLNRKRTLVTILGVIISVSMIVAVAVSALSFMDLLQRTEIKSSGDWNVLYQDVPKEFVPVISEDSNTRHTILSRDLGYSVLEGCENPDKPYLFLKAYNETGFEEYPLHLLKGRFPENSSELLISQHIEDNGGVSYAVGDKIEMVLGDRMWDSQDEAAEEYTLTQQNPYQNNSENEDAAKEKFVPRGETMTFTIVGIVERPEFEQRWAPGYSVFTRLDNTLLEQSETLNVATALHKVSMSIYKNSEKLAKQAHVPSEKYADNSTHYQISYNSSLNRYYAVAREDSLITTLYTVCAIIMIIIMIGSVSLIYNAFSISISERSRHLGMLSSIGATKKQRRQSVFFEGVLIGTISIPLGVLAGIAGMGVTFLVINPVLTNSSLLNLEPIHLIVSPVSILVSVIVSVITIFISTYWPAKRASKITPIDAIRQNQDVKLTHRLIKTSRLTRKIFGFEAELGLKNLKRNKKRYRSTIFSLVISVVLFLSVSAFTFYTSNSYKMTGETQKIDFHIYSTVYNTDIDTLLSAEKQVAELDGIESSVSTRSIYGYSVLDETYWSDYLKEYYDSLGNTSDYTLGRYGYNIVTYDDDFLKKYCKEQKIDFDSLNDPESRNVILLNHSTPRNGSKYADISTLNIKEGGTLTLQRDIPEEAAQTEITVHSILMDDYPSGQLLSSDAESFTAIVTNDVFEQIVKDLRLENEITLTQYLTMEDSFYQNAKRISDFEKSYTAISRNLSPTMMYNDVQLSKQESDNINFMMNVFVYGFISLITLICIANIFNTISTSMALRKREFAMLKSVGMTPASFHKMIRYESIFYGIKALLYGLPISFFTMSLIYLVLNQSFDQPFTLPWSSVFAAIIFVFVVVGVTMLYSGSKLKNDNIVDTLKQENI